MNEVKMHNQIKAAMTPPPAPAGLAERTIQRGLAIRRGLQAEEALHRLGAAPAGAESADYAAEAVVGRMAQRLLPPEGVTAAAMVQQLRGKPQFREAVQKSADQLLAEIQNGTLVQVLTAPKPPQREGKAPPPQKQEPTEPIL